MATVEYAALAVLVSAVLAVGGAATDGRAIGAAVGAQLRKGLCVVAGGDCFSRGGPRPCVVGSRSQRAEHRLSIAVVRLRDGRTVVLEERSDGTRRVVLTQWTGAGAGAQFGVDVAGLQADVDAEAGGDLAYGRAFVVADAAAARRLVERLEDEGPVVGGALPGVVRFLRGAGDGEESERRASVTSRVEAQAALEAIGLGPRAGALRDLTGSIGLDRRTGDRTLGLKLGGEAMVTLGAALGQAAAGMVVPPTGVELVFDARRRPRELVLRGAAGIHGKAELPSGGIAGGDLREVQARLDLTDPVARRLVDRLLDGDAGAVRPLAERLAQRARIDVRHYATTRDEDSHGGSAFGLGASRSTSAETMRLVAAAGREPGLGWSRRLDCVLAA